MEVHFALLRFSFKQTGQTQGLVLSIKANVLMSQTCAWQRAQIRFEQITSSLVLPEHFGGISVTSLCPIAAGGAYLLLHKCLFYSRLLCVITLQKQKKLPTYNLVLMLKWMMPPTHRV